jgi:hypothetical protein
MKTECGCYVIMTNSENGVRAEYKTNHDCDRHSEQNVAQLEARVAEADANFKIACRTLTELETRDPDKRIAELETALNELNSFDAPAELVEARATISRLTAERDKLKAFVVERLGVSYEWGYWVCLSCKNRTQARADLEHAPDCMWRAMGGGNG